MHRFDGQPFCGGNARFSEEEELLHEHASSAKRYKKTGERKRECARVFCKERTSDRHFHESAQKILREGTGKKGERIGEQLKQA